MLPMRYAAAVTTFGYFHVKLFLRGDLKNRSFLIANCIFEVSKLNNRFIESLRCKQSASFRQHGAFAVPLMFGITLIGGYQHKACLLFTKISSTDDRMTAFSSVCSFKDKATLHNSPAPITGIIGTYPITKLFSSTVSNV